MRLRIASRKSDLARIQAYQVGQFLKKHNTGLEVDYEFSASLGDKNLTDPLWKMPEKGVFTNDFYEGLVNDKYDLVVHSWKDLPTERGDKTVLAGSLKRADERDLLLVKKSFSGGVLNIFSSSPRRAYNLAPLIPTLMPYKIKEIQFKDVRGNIQTRIDKLLEASDIDALVVAKAAIDRLLSAPGEEFKDSVTKLRSCLDQLKWMVLPLSENPCAPAQGALAIEVRKDNEKLLDFLKPMLCQKTYEACVEERSVLKKYGGGCHQKIGVSVRFKDYGEIKIVRGITQDSQKLEVLEHKKNKAITKAKSVDKIFPPEIKTSGWFDRKPQDISKLSEGSLIWLAKAESLSSKPSMPANSYLWASGVKSWQKLAGLGYWVHGCSESLGEQEDPMIDHLCGPLNRIKITHNRAPDLNNDSIIAGYTLNPKTEKPDLKNKTHFYWMSGSSFDEALKDHPEILNAHHACGPGNTYKHLKKILPQNADLQIFISYKHWKKDVLDE